MDLLLFSKTLCFSSRNRHFVMGGPKTQIDLRSFRERGEVILPLVFTILMGSFLFSSLFWLNQHYEKKTKEHLGDFAKNWERLEKKYKN